MYIRHLISNVLITRLIILAGVLMGMFHQVNAQTDTEFWFAAPDINQWHSDRPVFMRMTSLNLPTVVTITQPANPAFPVLTYTLPPFTTQSVNLTPYIDMIECNPVDSVLNYGMRIKATQAITAYYEVVSNGLNPEIFSLKGRNSVGTTFLTPFQNFVPSIQPVNNVPYHSGFIIVATTDNTTVTITPSQDAVGHPAGIPFTITLNRGQTFAVVSATIDAAGKLAGSSVVSDKPITVTVYDDSVYGGYWSGTCVDLCGDQIIPVEVTGSEYIVIRGWLSNGIEKIFIVATQDNTQIFVGGSPTPIATINQGQTYMHDLVTNSLYVQSSKPVYLCHLSGFGCELGMPILPPVNCTGSRTLGFTRSVNQFFGIILLVKNGHQGNFVLNGSSSAISPAEFSVVPGTNGEWVAARIDLTYVCPVVTGSRISNTTALFHLGIFNGNNFSGCRYGYFSDFSNIYLGADVLKCPLDSVTLDAGYGKYSYLWSTGDTTQTITVTAPGTYWVVADNGDCFVSDTININDHYILPVDLGNDTAICNGSPFTLSPSGSYFSYLWSTGDTTAQITVTQSNHYRVTVSDEICEDTTSKTVIFLNSMILTPDTIVCEGDDLSIHTTITAGFEDLCQYLWSTGDTTPSITVTPQGNTVYYLTVSCLNTQCTDQISVSVVNGAFSIGPDTALCAGNAYTIHGPPSSSFYLWSNGSTASSITPAASGQYWLEANSAEGCFFRDTMNLNYQPLPLDLGDVIYPSTNGLIAWYPFDGNLNDSSGFYQTALNTGVDFTADHNNLPGRAVHFNGNAFLRVRNTNALKSPHTGFTFLARLRADNLGSGNGSLLCKSNEVSAAPCQYRAGFQSNSMYFGYKNAPATVFTQNISYSLPLTQWNISAFTFDGSNIRYFINHHQTGQAVASGLILPDEKDLIIGRDPYGVDEYYTGDLDDLRLFNRPLCAYEMSLISLPRVMNLATTNALICAGDSLHIQLNYPQPGISYQMFTYPGNQPFGPPQITYCDSVMVFPTGPLTSGIQFRILAVDTAYGCQRWLSDIIDVGVKPTPDISVYPLNPVICAGDSVLLSVTSTLGGTHYQWNTGDTSATLMVHPLASTLYFVSGEKDQCLDSAQVTVSVKPRPEAGIVPADTVICNGDHIVLTATSTLPSSQFSWSSGAQTATINVSPSATTLYLLTVSLDGCSDTAHRLVSVKPSPEITITPDAPQICSQDTISLTASCNLLNPLWQWTNGPAAATMVLTLPLNQYYSVQCTVDGCTAADSVLMTVFPDPVVNITTGNPSICQGAATVLQVSSSLYGTAFTWSNGQNGSQISVSPETTTLYTVTGHFGNCSGTDTLILYVRPNPVATVNPADTTVCKGDSYVLRGSSSLPSSTFLWNTGSTLQHMNVRPLFSLQYTLLVNADGCTDTANAFVHVIAAPEINLGPDRYLCSGESEFLSLYGDFTSCLWSDGSSENFLLVTQPGYYWVRVTNEACPASDSLLLMECSELWIPNSFTPNNDGVNDVFLPKGVEIENFEMLIFNRWGEHLFTSDNLETGWDGTFQGEIAKCDVYYYLIRYTRTGRAGKVTDQVRNGWITLLK